MDISLAILILLVAATLLAVFKQGKWALVAEGLHRSRIILFSMWWKVLLGIILAGFVQILIPKETIAEWMGPASGMIGIFAGSFAGMILTGGAFVVIPIIGSIYAAGAGAGPIIALLTAANLTRIQGLIAIEMPIFGIRLSMTRYVICLLVPPVIGFLGSVVFRLL
jgi:uncharacterized membrane protein YraQ (UPF0718 family)